MKEMKQLLGAILKTVQAGAALTLASCQTELPGKATAPADPPIAAPPVTAPVLVSQPPPPPPASSIQLKDIARVCPTVTPTSFDSIIVGKSSLGEPCLADAAQEACQRDINEKLARLTEGEALVIQKGGASAVLPLSGVSTVFGSVDAVDKALAILLAKGQRESFCDGYVGEVGVQFQQSISGGGGCGSARVLTVSSTGELKDEIVRMPCKGRRPDGLIDADAPSTTSLGSFFARAAWEEAASVPAFHLLARDLARLGAPQQIIARALASAADETRHAAQMTALASRFGAQPATPLIEAPAPKALIALALENLREGCVHETFAALIAMYQAQHASDPEIAAAMRDLADEEAQHSALAWDIHHWALSQLSASEQLTLQAALRDALSSLHRAPTQLSCEDAALLGWPTPEVQSSLAQALREALS